MDLETARSAYEGKPGVALMDNPAEGVWPTPLLEASGGVHLDTVAAIAESGVDFVSVGYVTHSAPSLDLGLDFSVE